MDIKSPTLRRGTAIRMLAPGCAYNSKADGTIIKWLTSDIPQPSEGDIDAKVAEYKIEFDANKYQRDRAVSYPTWQEQMDMQYHDLLDGTTTWKDAIAKVKADNPKDNP